MNNKIYQYWIQVILFLTLFQYGFYFYIHKTRFLNQIDDVLIIALFLHLLLVNKKNNYITRNKSKYDLLLLSLIILSIASSYLNQTPLINFLLGIKGYFLYFILFYCIYWINFDKKEIENIIDFSLKLFIIELVVSVIQLLWGINTGSLNGDSIFGTFNGPNYFGYSIFILLYFALYSFYINKKRNYLIYIIILLILLFMSSARLAIILLPIIFIILNYKKLASKINYKQIIFIICIILLIPLIVNNSFMFKDGKIQDYFTINFVKNHFENTENDISSGSARNLWYPLTKEQLDIYSYNPLIGFGPGMYASHAAMYLMPESNARIYNYFNQLNAGVDTNIDSQIIPIWGELGYIGIILFYILLFLILFRTIKINREMKDPLLKAVSSSTIAYTIFFIIGFYMHHILESQTTALLLFLFVGFTEAQYRLMKKRENEKK